MSNQFYVEPEGLSGPDLWQYTDRPDEGMTLVLRKAELPGPYDELLWRVVTGVLAPDDATVERVADALRSTPADWPGWEREREWSEHLARAVLAALADPDTGGAA